MSTISEVNNFLLRKAFIPMKRSIVKEKVKKPLPVKWVFNIKEEPDGSICLKLTNFVNGYMKIPVVVFTELFWLVASDTSKTILIELTLYHGEYGWVAELHDV